MVTRSSTYILTSTRMYKLVCAAVCFPGGSVSVFLFVVENKMNIASSPAFARFLNHVESDEKYNRRNGGTGNIHFLRP